ncbi:DNA cytosine methyltransferase [Oharaeibacter diazotrophicus]|uniref:Cytosine-specific methyltransferase n=2 Tax=Oharaeibacter diazotrophicus TaxID=1920512 RepID=A0A4R6RP50_9HYPH|nr:DNA (cytosine-5-)-methyltransferase [Oharaeibacter diazotrophicus]TDP87616.1 DNA (cytosine-5)-methyltransferase 1 [Oharaeibacter diazotrophicus]BBE70440.1 putative BsuMI modification methylase subunit YdiP [Pleomorphomonas sp. SM30]GLS77183.1 putative BsuMI modification methylase subunit YdiP [Oharaeibacter diazotrophicus]
MRVAGLFAGIGGFERGLAAAGHGTALACEIWEPARAVLAARFPGLAVARDVAALDRLPEDVDLVVGGFPCQDLSQAGTTAGIDGGRSGLVGHVFRLLDARPAPWVVLENVSFMLHLDRGRAMTRLVEAFEARGYHWAYRVVNSLAFLPQRRERVIFVATTTAVDPAGVLFADDAAPPATTTALGTHAHGFYWTEGVRGLGWAADAVPTLKNGSTVGIASPPAVLLPDGRVVTPDIRDAERLQGFPAGWTEPATAAARGSLRWALVGNAVTVPVAEWVGRRLASPGVHDTARDGPLDGRWPRAARSDGRDRRAVAIGAFPVWRDRPPLAAFLSHPGKPLSSRATRGFLGRAGRGTLRFAPGFLDRLRDHLGRMDGAAQGIAAE